MLSVGTQAQRKNSRYVDYIDKYKDLAIEQMKEHKIPASITLAQGLLESGAGMSEPARKSNNHFGIKCGGSWRGVRCGMMMMPARSVSGLIKIQETLMRIILRF